MFEVVAYIARLCAAGAGPMEDPFGLRDELLDAGFPEEDVERALAWIHRLKGQRLGDAFLLESPSPSLRHPTAVEALKITAGARGLLLRLERGGHLTSAMREAVYEKALTLDLPQVGVEEMCVLLALLFRASGRAGEHVAARILLGDLEGLCH
jgi:Smg protein